MTTLIFILSLLIQKPVFCSCQELGLINDDHYNAYQLIAKAKVVKVTVVDYEAIIEVAVVKYFKGGNGQRFLKISSASDESICGIVPQVGERWLLFAQVHEKGYRTGLCTRTKNMNSKAKNYRKEELAEDLKYLEAKTQSRQR